jgi:WS/DGAT/MGAT family acyltransferase
MLSDKPSGHLLNKSKKVSNPSIYTEESFSDVIKHAFDVLVKQAKAVPEASSMMANFGLDFLRGKKDRPQLPFSAPHTILNKELTSRRQFITSTLPLKKVRELGKVFGGTVNDVLITIIGSALRAYLLEQGALPERSLAAGLPVSIKSQGKAEGNQLSFIICPFATEESDLKTRIDRIIKTTKKAKHDLAHISPKGSEDLATMTMIPFLLMALTHTSQKLPPVFNTIVSNIPGPRKQMYLEGAKVEQIFPLSVVTDGMGLNITVISYLSKLCIGITCAPGSEPNIKSLEQYIQGGFQELIQLAK